MPPKLSLRRLFLTIVLCGTLIVVITNVRQNWIRWMDTNTGLDMNGDDNFVVEPVYKDLIEQLEQPRQERQIENLNNIEIITTQSIANDDINKKFWFFRGGTIRPKSAKKNKTTGKRIANLYPSEDPVNDRIIDQLMYIPPDYTDDVPLKKILVYNGLGSWSPVKSGSSIFVDNKCPVNRCTLTTNTNEATDADAILFKDSFRQPAGPRPSSQIWILYYLECPYHTSSVNNRDAFNWTSTYRRDSDLVAPYERWTYFDSNIRQIQQDRNYAANKTKKVAWFVSNCGARNGRLEYVKELQKYIQVDIYGACGPLKCSKTKSKDCFSLLNNDYKFYLAFENSNCQDYMTEKFFVNGLGQNVLPIVMGARPEEYERSAPHRSFIHVDEFETPRELASYLHRLDKDDDLYNAYFRWKGTGEFINTYFWCRLCSMLHDPISTHQSHYYEDVNNWWRGPGVCAAGSWRKSLQQHSNIDEKST